ncbi:tumor necrosis factor receptor superfamily member 13C [Ambystoma mexicanum]|uniref:tumor necrosis factor receptor superfamily member 13C n=1 Tax=Ambystoma mexicanum TaxID=8296 RepID=UPI0037E86EE0
MAQSCKDSSQHYDELIKACVPDDIDADDASEERDMIPLAGPTALVPPFVILPTTDPPAIGPPLVISSSVHPRKVPHRVPPCGFPHATTSSPVVPPETLSSPVVPHAAISPAMLPHATFAPASVEFPVMAVVVTFLVATLVWLGVLSALLWRRRGARQNESNGSGQALVDQLEKGNMAALIEEMIDQSGCEGANDRHSAAPPSIPMAIECSANGQEEVDHAFPLPATELGATLLVTTKTIKGIEDTSLEGCIQ